MAINHVRAQCPLESCRLASETQCSAKPHRTLTRSICLASLKSDQREGSRTHIVKRTSLAQSSYSQKFAECSKICLKLKQKDRQSKLPGVISSKRKVSATRAAVSDVSTATELPPFLPKEAASLEDKDALEMAKRMKRLPVMTSLAPEAIQSSFVGPSWAGETNAPSSSSNAAPIVLLAGFDSSCLEYRKLLPQLERKENEVWAVDLLGWGFSSASEGKGPAVSSFGPVAKREHFYSFWRTYIKRPMVLVGTSLGGAVAIDFALEHPDAVDRLVLIDAQVFVDGVGNKANLPRWIANAGVQFLKSWPLRSFANGLSFYDRSLATKGAVQAGQLHTLLPGWPDAMMSFMSSGGYSLTARLGELTKQSLVLWGRQDRILETKYALRFEKEVPNSRLVWIEESGHLPNLEQPEKVAQLIVEYAAE